MTNPGDSEETRVDKALLKIKSGAEKFSSLEEYCYYIIKKLDTNKDGLISYLELAEGMNELGIKIFKGQLIALVRRLDEDRIGGISYNKLLKALQSV